MTNEKSGIEKISDYTISFFIYSVVIWIVNAVSKWLVFPEGGFDGGILYGPYAPFFALMVMGVMLVFNLIKKFGKDKDINPTGILLILMSIVLFLGMEYLGSLVIEFITDVKPWDYTNNIFNINGRICWENAIFLTVFELITVFVTQPFLNRKLEKLWLSARIIIAMTVVTVIITDVICTCMK